MPYNAINSIAMKILSCLLSRPSLLCRADECISQNKFLCKADLTWAIRSVVLQDGG